MENVKDLSAVPELFSGAVERVMRELFAPVAELERLKRKPFLTPREASVVYGIPVKSLATYRCRGGGPAYEQREKGGPVFYTHEALRAYQGRRRDQEYAYEE